LEIAKKIYALFGIEPGALRNPIPEYNPPEKPPTDEGVYLLRADNGLIKIGCTSNLQKRIADITIYSPCEITLIGFFRCKDFHKKEAKLHQQFAGKRIRGEWFNLDEADLMALNKRFNLGLSISEKIYEKYKK
jgi:hypothetical protein